MRLLLTRPREDAEALAEILSRRGHQAIVAPLMDVQFLAGPPLVLDGVQGLLATSANGIRAAAARTERRDLTIYAVGPQTAESARAAGFTHIVSAEGDAAALVGTVARTVDPAQGALLHVAGAETAGRVQQSLQANGFRVESVVLYEAIPAVKLPVEAMAAMSQDQVDGVLLFSPRSAKTFAFLVTEAELAAKCEGLTAFCISAATAAALQPLNFGRIAVAGAPNQDSILDLIPPP